MEGNIYEFMCLCFSRGPAPRIFTKLLKISIAILKRSQIKIIIYLDNILLMSHTINGLEIARDTLIVLLQSLCFVINLTKSVLVPLQKRDGDRLSQDDINTTTRKSKKIETQMPKAYFKPQNSTMRSNQPCRFSLFDCTGRATGYAANQVFTTTANSSYKKQSLLPVCNVPEPGFYS